jgi:hypothetical protein
MEKFTQHTGIAAALLQDNIDTDAIIPSREMKAVSKHGLGEGLFAGWRYLTAGSRDKNPDFILNKPEYANSSILLAGSNFGRQTKDFDFNTLGVVGPCLVNLQYWDDRFLQTQTPVNETFSGTF